MPRFYKVGRWLKLQLSKFGRRKRVDAQKQIDEQNDKMCALLTMYGNGEEE